MLQRFILIWFEHFAFNVSCFDYAFCFAESNPRNKVEQRFFKGRYIIKNIYTPYKARCWASKKLIYRLNWINGIFVRMLLMIPKSILTFESTLPSTCCRDFCEKIEISLLEKNALFGNCCKTRNLSNGQSQILLNAGILLTQFVCFAPDWWLSQHVAWAAVHGTPKKPNNIFINKGLCLISNSFS